MKSLIIQGTDDTPTVILNPSEKQFIISGRSLPEDVNIFYQPILNWLNNFSSNPFNMVLETKLDYFNTASSKILLDIFLKLEEIMQATKINIEVQWFYDAKDEEMLEAGEEYMDLVEGLSFTFHPL